MSENKKSNFSLDFERTISVQTVIAIMMLCGSMVAGFVMVQTDLDHMKIQQRQDEQFKHEVQSKYVSREQLDYIVIERLDRLEKQLEAQLNRIEKKINE